MEKLVKINSLNLWTENFGKFNDPACLLISGAGAHSRFWTDHFCKNLSNKGYFIIRYDHRDTGLSSPVDISEEPYNLNELAKDALAILDDYQIKRFHLIGHSMGGIIAQILSIFHSTRVLSLTCISSAIPQITYSLSKEEKEIYANTLKVLLANRPNNNYEKSIDGFIKIWKYLHGNIEMDEKIARQYTKGLYTRSRHDITNVYKHANAMQRLPNHSKSLNHLFLPSLVIHGAKDPLIFLSQGKALAEAIPSSDFCIIPDMGHTIFSHHLENTLIKIIAKHMQKSSSQSP